MLHRLQGRVIRESRENDPAERERAEKEAVGLLESVDITRVRSSASDNRRREALDLADQLRAAAEQKYSRNLFADPRIGNVLASALWYTTEFGAPQAALSLSDAVEHLGEVLGPDHPSTLASRNNLAGAHESAGRLGQAIALYEQTLADRLRILGPDHPDTLASRNNLAYAHQAAGRLDQAIPLYEQNLTDSLRILGPDHPSTKIFRNNLASAYQAAGRSEDATALFDPPPDSGAADADRPDE